MSVYRSRIRVVADILKTARDECDEDGLVKVSVLLRKANLSYTRLVAFLRELVGNGLLDEVRTERGHAYKITRRGIEFLEEFERFERFAKTYGLRI